MKRILVTTDFSANSKAALRFAIQLASQNKFELIYFHAYSIMKPVSWTNERFAEYERNETRKVIIRLERYVENTYKLMRVNPEGIKCVIKSSLFADSAIREYAMACKADYICISEKGAGRLRRIIGTTTSSLINNSPVPVIAVPSQYRKIKIAKILYASDLTQIDKELKIVMDFSKLVKAKVELLHFNYPAEISAKSKILNKAANKYSDNNIIVHLEETDLAKSLVLNIESALQKSKPSMMIMFTEQNRSFFQKIFLTGNSAGYSFRTKVPLLVYNKMLNKR